jgi:ribosomal protein S18 acetylase RimI-like enzyme
LKLSIVSLCDKHVHSLVVAYQTVFPSSFSSCLGAKFLGISLRHMLHAPNSCSLVMIDDIGAVLGFALGTIGAAPQMSLSDKMAICSALLIRVFRDPSILGSLWIRRNHFIRRFGGASDSKTLHLASFGLVSSVRGKGYADYLLECFESSANKRGALQGILGVEKENIAAVRFYTRNSWIVESEVLSAYSRISYRMTKLLKPRQS